MTTNWPRFHLISGQGFIIVPWSITSSTHLHLCACSCSCCVLCHHCGPRRS